MKKILALILGLVLAIPALGYGQGFGYNYETFKQRSAKPSSPPSTYNRLYFKTDGKLYYVDSAGTEAEAGASFSATTITGQTDDSTPATTATAVLSQGGSLIKSTLGQIATAINANGTHTGATTLDALLYSAAQAVTVSGGAISGITKSVITVTPEGSAADTVNAMTCTGTCPSVLLAYNAVPAVTLGFTDGASVDIQLGSTVTVGTGYAPFCVFSYDTVSSKYVTLTIPDTFNVTSWDLSSASYSIPMVLGTAAAPTEAGRTYLNSTTKVLTVGDGTVARRVPMNTTATALTAGAAVALTVGARLYTDTVTDNEDQTITFSGAGSAGDEITIIFTTAGASDEIITFHATLVSSVGTLTLGTDAGKYYVVRFVSNGTHWFEVSRTAVQT